MKYHTVMQFVLCAVLTAGTAIADEPSGGRIYLDNCALCHGEDGRGPTYPDYNGPMLVSNAFLKSQSDTQLTAFLNKGRAADAPDSQTHMVMPPFNYLSVAEMTRLVAFLRTFTPSSK